MMLGIVCIAVYGSDAYDNGYIWNNWYMI